MMALALKKSLQFLIILVGFVCVVSGNASAAKKVALVIGTDAYQNLPVLQKAVNDARAITETLSNIGFEVIKGENLTRRQMNRSLANLERTISPGDQVFFFFAGHGVALGATNYLIPADMPLPDAGEESLVRGEAFAVDQIVERIQARGAIASFVVLDACRNNPFKTKGVRSIGSTRGLRDISAPKGVFVLFSAGIGQTALDRLNDGDENPNSVFTRNLVPLLKQPGLSHVQLAKRVQSNVDKLARTVRHEQQPAYYDQVIGNMYLVKNETQKRTKPTAKKLVVPNTVDRARIVYHDIKNSGDIRTLEIFTKQFPNSIYAKFARGKIDALNASKIRNELDKQKAFKEAGVNNRQTKFKEAAHRWSSLKSSTDIGALKQFILDFSDTDFVPVAENRIALLREKLIDTKLESNNDAIVKPKEIVSKNTIRAIQRELNRLGCDAGKADGKWGKNSSKALAKYSKYSKVHLVSLEPDNSVLGELKKKTSRICPLICEPGFENQNNKCIVKKLKTQSKNKSPSRKAARIEQPPVSRDVIDPNKIKRKWICRNPWTGDNSHYYLTNYQKWKSGFECKLAN